MNTPHCSVCGNDKYALDEYGYTTCCEAKVCSGSGDDEDLEFEVEGGLTFCCMGGVE